MDFDQVHSEKNPPPYQQPECKVRRRTGYNTVCMQSMYPIPALANLARWELIVWSHLEAGRRLLFHRQSTYTSGVTDIQRCSAHV